MYMRAFCCSVNCVKNYVDNYCYSVYVCGCKYILNIHYCFCWSQQTLKTTQICSALMISKLKLKYRAYINIYKNISCCKCNAFPFII